MIIPKRRISCLLIIIIIITGMSSSSLMLPLVQSQKSTYFSYRCDIDDSPLFLNQSDNQMQDQRKNCNIFNLHDEEQLNNNVPYGLMKYIIVNENSISYDIFLIRLYHYLSFLNKEGDY